MAKVELLPLHGIPVYCLIAVAQQYDERLNRSNIPDDAQYSSCH